MRTLIGLAFIALTPVCADACETNGRGALLGSGVAMHLRPGETCAFSFHSMGSSFGLGGTATRMSVTIKSIRIVAKPEHGQAGLAGLNGIAYKATPAFQGADSFQIEVQTDQQTVPVRVSIDVK